jgi:hypothetical protein
VAAIAQQLLVVHAGEPRFKESTDY